MFDFDLWFSASTRAAGSNVNVPIPARIRDLWLYRYWASKVAIFTPFGIYAKYKYLILLIQTVTAIYLYQMITEKEQEFLEYWEVNRVKKKKLFRQLSVGLPLSVVFVIAITANFLSGWYKRADMEIRSQSSLILIVIIAALAIVIFITIFSARHKWEMYEQQYREILSRRDFQ